MAFNYNDEVIDLLLKKSMGTAYTRSGLVPGQETQVLEKFHNLQVFFDTITDKNESNFTWSSPIDLGSVPANTTCLTTSSQVNVVSSGGNKYVFNGDTSYDSSKKYGLYSTTYTFTNVPSGHPIAILNSGNSYISYTGDTDKKFSKTISGSTNDGTYDFYYGDVSVTVTGNFGTVSVYCYYHGYMGGENLLTYTSVCQNPGGSLGTVSTLDNVTGESNPDYFTHIKKYENIPMTVVAGTEYRAWRPTNSDLVEKFKNVILGKPNFNFSISSNITNFSTIHNTSSAFKPIINNGVLVFMGNSVPAGNNTISMKEVYICDGYAGTIANILLNDISDISSSNPLNTHPLIFDGSTQKWSEGNLGFNWCPIQDLGDLDDLDTGSAVPNDGVFWNGFTWSSDILVYLMNHFSNIDTGDLSYNNVYPSSLVYDDLSGNFKAKRLQFPVTTLNDVSNVNMTTVIPQNDQILLWDEGFEEWVADNVSAPINHLNDISGINVDNIKFGEGIVLDPSGGNKFITKAIPRKIDSIQDLADVNIADLNIQIPQWSQILKMDASDEDINDNFGSAVAMNDDYMLIGSYNAQGVSLSDVGKVYVWKKSYSTFSDYQILAPNLQSTSMNFGSSVTIQDNFLMVGAPNRFFNSKEKAGSVYYYKYNGGTAKWGILNNGPYKEDELIQHGTPAAFDRFGCSISVDGNYMIIGASGKGGGGKGKACIYKYQSNNWVFVKDIVGSTSANNDEFGHKVQVLGNLAYASAPNHNTNRGIIYIFNRTNGGSDNWGEIQKVIMESAYINTYFGNDFCFGSSWGIIGSKRSNTLEGQAYFIYYNSSTERWGTQGITDYQPEQTIAASDGAPNDMFGYAVSLNGNDAIVGAYKKKGDGTNETGGAYIYKYTGENYWELHKQLNGNDIAQNDEYGISVFMHNKYAMVGSWKEESSNTDLNAGAAYLFHIPNALNGGTRCVIYDTDVNRYVVGMITSAGVGVLINNLKQLRDISGADWTNTTDISNNSMFFYDDTLLPVKLRYEVRKPGTMLTISDISDVDLSGAETGNALIYDASLNKWLPGDAGGEASGVGVFNAPPDPPTTGQMYFDSSDNKFYGRLKDTWEEILTHGTGYFFGHSSDTLRDLSGVSSSTSFSIIWENPVQRKSPIAAKNASDKVDNALYLPIINDMYIEIQPVSQNYGQYSIKIGGKNLNTGVVSGNTTQKLSVYSTASQQLTTGVIVYKTGQSPSGFSGTKDKIELIGGKQVYRINPSTLTLASGTTYKARVWFRNSSPSDNKYKEIKGISL